MVFKERDEWLATGLKSRFKKFEKTDEYKEVKKVSDLINKIKTDQKNNITHGEIHTKLPNFTLFEHDILTCLTLLDNKTYEYDNVETKKMDVINFPDYKKWYKENKAVWNSRAYGNAQSKVHYLDNDYARIFIKRREDSYSMKPNLMQILERINKVYTKNGHRINESTDWVHYFYQPSNNLKSKQDLRNYPASYWEDIRQLSYKYHNEDDYKKRAYSIYSEEKNFRGAKEKDPFLAYDDEKKQGIMVYKADNVKYYVSVDIYLNRENNFLKHLANVKYVKHEANAVFPNKYPKDRLKRGYFEKYFYEVLNHNVTAGIQTTKDDFI